MAISQQNNLVPDNTESLSSTREEIFFFFFFLFFPFLKTINTGLFHLCL